MVHPPLRLGEGRPDLSGLGEVSFASSVPFLKWMSRLLPVFEADLIIRETNQNLECLCASFAPPRLCGRIYLVSPITLPQPQRFISVEITFIFFKLPFRQYKCPDLAVDQFLYFINTKVEVILVDISHDDKIDNPAVPAFGVVAGNEGHLKFAQVVNNIVNDLINAQVLVNQCLQLII